MIVGVVSQGCDEWSGVDEVVIVVVVIDCLVGSMADGLFVPNLFSSLKKLERVKKQISHRVQLIF